MPMFFGNTKGKESPLSTAIRPNFGLDYKPRRSNANRKGRPQTSGGAAVASATTAQTAQNHPVARFPLPRWPSSLSSQSTVSLAMEEAVMRDDQCIGIAVGSPSDSQTPAAMYRSAQDLHVAVAEVQPQQTLHEDIELNVSEETHESRVKRWRSVGGLFNKKRAVALTPSASEEIYEEVCDLPHPRPPTQEDPRRQSISFRRYKKPLAPPLPAIDGKFKNGSTSHVALPTASSNPRQVETNPPPAKKPALEIEIPKAGLDRYSVMFSKVLEPSKSPQSNTPRQSLLARRTGVEGLTIVSPPLIKSQTYSSLEEEEQLNEDGEEDGKISLTREPATRRSLITYDQQYRLSALPAPLFSNSNHNSNQNNHQLKHARSAIGILSINKPLPPAPEDLSAITESNPQPSYPLTPRSAFSAPETPAISPLVAPNDIVYCSKRNSAVSDISASTSNTDQNRYSPSPISSTYSYDGFLEKAVAIRTTSVSSGSSSSSSRSKSRPPPAATLRSNLDSNSLDRASSLLTTTARNTTTSEADVADDKASHLAIPSSAAAPSIPCTPWDLSKAFPSPLNPSDTPSPRMQFGYDGLHSPLIAVAKTVTICVRAGQGKGQKPQFVVHERDARTRSAVAIAVGCVDA